MRVNFLNRITSIFNRGNYRGNMNMLVFAFFLVLSTVFWLLNALNKRYKDTVSYPVHYNSFPQGKINIRELPGELKIQIEAPGYKILRHKLNARINPIDIDVAGTLLRRLQGEQNEVFYLLTRYELENIAVQMSADITVLDVDPDTLYFEFDQLVSKKIPVKPDIKIDFKQQYMQVGNVKVSPDSVLASGPSIMLDTLKDIYTNSSYFENVSRPIDKSISLESDKNIALTPGKVEIFLDVDKYTETSLNVPVLPKNVPDSLSLKTFPRVITITYHVPLKEYDKISSDMFKATVDYNDIGATLSEKLHVTLEQYPPTIRYQNFRPRSVEYLIEK